jgi:hypothetical protein
LAPVGSTRKLRAPSQPRTNQTTPTPAATGKDAGEAQGLLGRPGRGLEQLPAETWEQRPEQAFDDENKAKCNREIVHCARGLAH